MFQAFTLRVHIEARWRWRVGYEPSYIPTATIQI